MTAPRVAVAVSGGRDSTALLHCTVRAAVALGVEVVALHVHHGLMPEADAWLRQVQSQCRRWRVALCSRRLQTRPPRGASVEAWARAERYRALAEMAHEAACPLVLLAHHRRDQAETWLLQALRGGGPAGLSAMPQEAVREGLSWARPWLAQPREAIEAYVRRHRLKHANDDSNADPRYARSCLRGQVWPPLVQAFPDAEVSLARAAARAQESAALALETAALDLPALRQGLALRVPPWLALPPARRRNALRAWLAQALQAPVRESLVERLCTELPQRRLGRWPAPPAELRLYRGALTAAVPAAKLDKHEGTGNAASAAPRPRVVDLRCPGEYRFPPWAGRLVVRATTDGGAPAAMLRQVAVRARQGGESFRTAPGATARSLKKQYQACGVPSWHRGGPLLFTSAGELLFVPGLGLDGAQTAEPGQPQLSLTWVPDAPAAPAATGRRQPGG
ncbi:MAG: tRNA lysidine(34) synthetase TilS [Rubrivivax sp.]|nr:tRNA lysidine(34) synthetase TilS [Rubrivivax sp.]